MNEVLLSVTLTLAVVYIGILNWRIYTIHERYRDKLDDLIETLEILDVVIPEEPESGKKRRSQDRRIRERWKRERLDAKE